MSRKAFLDHARVVIQDQTNLPQDLLLMITSYLEQRTDIVCTQFVPARTCVTDALWYCPVYQEESYICSLPRFLFCALQSLSSIILHALVMILYIGCVLIPCFVYYGLCYLVISLCETVQWALCGISSLSCCLPNCLCQVECRDCPLALCTNCDFSACDACRDYLLTEIPTEYLSREAREIVVL